MARPLKMRQDLLGPVPQQEGAQAVAA